MCSVKCSEWLRRLEYCNINASPWTIYILTTCSDTQSEMMLDAIVEDNDYPTVFFYALLLYMIHYRCEYVNIFILSLTLFVCEAFNIFNPHSFFILQP